VVVAKGRKRGRKKEGDLKGISQVVVMKPPRVEGEYIYKEKVGLYDGALGREEAPAGRLVGPCIKRVGTSRGGFPQERRRGPSAEKNKDVRVRSSHLL